MSNQDQLPALAVESPLALIARMAADPNTDAEKLDKMLAVKERWEAAEAKKAFAFALAAFQAECPPVYKGRVVDSVSRNSGLRTTYAFAAKQDIERSIKPFLAKHGLAVSIYRSKVDDGKLIVEGCITHKDGYSQPIGGEVAVDKNMHANDTQKIGSASSYAWRYVVCPALGVSLTDIEDDDGKLAGSGASISQEQASYLQGLIEQTATDEAKFVEYFRCDTLDRLPLTKYGEAEKILTRKLQKMGGAR